MKDVCVEQYYIDTYYPFYSSTNINRKKKEREELEEALNARVRTADSDFYNDKGTMIFFLR